MEDCLLWMSLVVELGRDLLVQDSGGVGGEELK